MQLDTTMNIDLDEVNKFVESDDFIQFLLNHTTDLGTAAYVIQTLHEQVKKDKASLKQKEK